MSRTVTRKVERQWLLHGALMTTFGPSSPGYQGLIQDVQNAIIFPGRLLRLIGAVRLVTVDLITANSLGFIVFGLIRTKIGSAPSPNPVSANDADSGWLYRQTFRLPEYDIAVSGMLDLNGDDYHVDWQIYGGKGVQIDRDQELRLCVGGDFVSGAVNLTYMLNGLYEA